MFVLDTLSKICRKKFNMYYKIQALFNNPRVAAVGIKIIHLFIYSKMYKNGLGR